MSYRRVPPPLDPNGLVSEEQFNYLFFGQLADDPDSEARENLPEWFDPKLSFERRPTLFRDLRQSGLHGALQDQHDDLWDVRFALRGGVDKVFKIFEDENDEWESASFFATHRPFEDAVGIAFYHIEQGHGRYITRHKTAQVVQSLTRMKESFLEGERMVIDHESAMIETGCNFEASASRFERSKFRAWFKAKVADLRTEQGRQLFALPSSESLQAVGSVKAQPNNGPDDCSICYTNHAAPVFTKCCNRAFDADCLLNWALPNVRAGMTCPMCRANMDLEFLGELLEVQVKEMNVL